MSSDSDIDDGSLISRKKRSKGRHKKSKSREKHRKKRSRSSSKHRRKDHRRTSSSSKRRHHSDSDTDSSNSDESISSSEEERRRRRRRAHRKSRKSRKHKRKISDDGMKSDCRGTCRSPRKERKCDQKMRDDSDGASGSDDNKNPEEKVQSKLSDDASTHPKTETKETNQQMSNDKHGNDNSRISSHSKAKSMVPMTREQYEKQQSTIREVYDPVSKRYRLVRGTGEIIERIVSKSDHEKINKIATRGDGINFAQCIGSAAARRK